MLFSLQTKNRNLFYISKYFSSAQSDEHGMHDDSNKIDKLITQLCNMEKFTWNDYLEMIKVIIIYNNLDRRSTINIRKD
jgi:hypothetical protein